MTNEFIEIMLLLCLINIVFIYCLIWGIQKNVSLFLSTEIKKKIENPEKMESKGTIYDKEV